MMHDGISLSLPPTPPSLSALTLLSVDVVISLVASGCVLFLLIVLLLGLICWQRESSSSGRGYRHVTSGEDGAES